MDDEKTGLRKDYFASTKERLYSKIKLSVVALDVIIGLAFVALVAVIIMGMH